MLDLLYNQFVFTANTLGRHATTSQFFQPLTLQTSALVAAAIYCVFSKYATRNEITVMLSQDEYPGKFCPSTVIDCVTAEAIVLIKFKLHMVGLFHILPLVLLCYNWCSSISVGPPQPTSALPSHLQVSTILIGPPQSLSELLNPRRGSIIPTSTPQSLWCFAVCIGPSIFHPGLHTAISAHASPLG